MLIVLDLLLHRPQVYRHILFNRFPYRDVGIEVCRIWFFWLWFFFDCGLWNVECGLWNVDCGMWIVECGMWIVNCGLWIVDCGFDYYLNLHYSSFQASLFMWVFSTQKPTLLKLVPIFILFEAYILFMTTWLAFSYFSLLFLAFPACSCLFFHCFIVIIFFLFVHECFTFLTISKIIIIIIIIIITATIHFNKSNSIQFNSI